MAKLTLTCTRGSLVGTTVDFESGGPPISFGRFTGSAVAFDSQIDIKASSRHAEIRHVGSAFVLRDLGATNGTFVTRNGVESRVAGEMAVEDGMVIEFGKGGPLYSARIESNAPGDMPRTAFVDISQFDLDAKKEPIATSGPIASSGRKSAAPAAKSGSRASLWLGLTLFVVLAGGGVGGYLWWSRVQEQDRARAEAIEQERVAKEAMEAKAKTLATDLDVAKGSVRDAETKAKAIAGNLEATASKVDALQKNIEQVGLEKKQADQAHEQELAKTRAELEAKLAQQKVALEVLQEKDKVAAAVLSKFGPSLFMLISVRPDTKVATELCAGFALDARGYLGTSASCAAKLQAALAENLWVMARVTHSVEKTYTVKSWKRFADVKPDEPALDLAVLELDLHGDAMPASIAYAAGEVFSGFASGQSLFPTGFTPNKADDPTLEVGVAVIGMVPGADGKPSTTGAADVVILVESDLPAPLGAPVFNGAGQVSAVVGEALAADAGAKAVRIATRADVLSAILPPTEAAAPQ